MDLEKIGKGWQEYELIDKFMKVPRHYLDLQSRQKFDREHPDYEEGQFFEEQADNQDDAGRQWWERSSATKVLNKSQMGVLHYPQKRFAQTRPEIDPNQTSLLVFGGMPFVEQKAQTSAYLLTLKHKEK